VRDVTHEAVVDRLADADSVVEVGVGQRPAVAAALADRGIDVTATDIRKRPTPDSVRFVQDDVTDPEMPIYNGADALYALNLPPELQRPTATLARSVDARLLFTTLGGDPTLVDVERETIPGETLFVLRE
jgi:uncharacterized UPF0146 family protein